MQVEIDSRDIASIKGTKTKFLREAGRIEIKTSKGSTIFISFDSPCDIRELYEVAKELYDKNGGE